MGGGFPLQDGIPFRRQNAKFLPISVVLPGTERAEKVERIDGLRRTTFFSARESEICFGIVEGPERWWVFCIRKGMETKRYGYRGT